jgi:hypothetical protein
MTLDERAKLIEQLTGGTAYLVVVQPDGGVQVERFHPNGGSSGIGYGADTPQAMHLRSPLEHFRHGSSHEGQW